MQAVGASIAYAIVGVWPFGDYVTAQMGGSDRRYPVGEAMTRTVIQTSSAT